MKLKFVFNDELGQVTVDKKYYAKLVEYIENFRESIIQFKSDNKGIINADFTDVKIRLYQYLIFKFSCKSTAKKLSGVYLHLYMKKAYLVFNLDGKEYIFKISNIIKPEDELTFTPCAFELN